MIDLIARLKAAMEPDRELDAEIDALINGGFASHVCQDATRRSYGVGAIHEKDDGKNFLSCIRHAPTYTSSFDAAVMLIPEGWTWGHIQRCDRIMDKFAALLRPNIDGKRTGDFWTEYVVGVGKLPQTALCIAALKARLTQKGTT